MYLQQYPLPQQELIGQFISESRCCPLLSVSRLVWRGWPCVCSQQHYCFGNSPKERGAVITSFTPTLSSPLSIGSCWMGSRGGERDRKKENSAACCLCLHVRRQITGVHESRLETLRSSKLVRLDFFFLYVWGNLHPEPPNFLPGFKVQLISHHLRLYDSFFFFTKIKGTFLKF